LEERQSKLKELIHPLLQLKDDRGTCGVSVVVVGARVMSLLLLFVSKRVRSRTLYLTFFFSSFFFVVLVVIVYSRYSEGVLIHTLHYVVLGLLIDIIRTG
jgi:hypothetical protein